MQNHFANSRGGQNSRVSTSASPSSHSKHALTTCTGLLRKNNHRDLILLWTRHWTRCSVCIHCLRIPTLILEGRHIHSHLTEAKTEARRDLGDHMVTLQLWEPHPFPTLSFLVLTCYSSQSAVSAVPRPRGLPQPRQGLQLQLSWCHLPAQPHRPPSAGDSHRFPAMPGCESWAAWAVSHPCHTPHSHCPALHRVVLHTGPREGLPQQRCPLPQFSPSPAGSSKLPGEGNTGSI